MVDLVLFGLEDDMPPQEDAVLFAVDFDHGVLTYSEEAIQQHKSRALPKCLMRPTPLQGSRDPGDDSGPRTYTEFDAGNRFMRPHLILQAAVGYDGPIYCSRAELEELVGWLDEHFSDAPTTGRKTHWREQHGAYRKHCFSAQQFTQADIERIRREEAFWSGLDAWASLSIEDQEGTSWSPAKY